MCIRDRDGYWNNLYYYSHESLEKVVIQIIRSSENYQIKIIGELDDPIDWSLGKAKYEIIADLKLSGFNSIWTS